MTEDRAKPTIDFSPFIADRTQHFTGREWVFAEIDRWLADPGGPTFFIITGEPGVGKSAIAARLTQRRNPAQAPRLAETPRLAAYHFCIARDSQTIDPALFARSLSQQLCRFDGFAAGILVDSNIDLTVAPNIGANYGQLIAVQVENLVLNAPSAAEAFNRAVLAPLRALCAGEFDEQVVILVDALDEAVRHQGSPTIVELLANAGPLPRQVRWVLTSRPEGAALRHFEQRRVPRFVLDAGRAENLRDIRQYIGERITASAELQARLAEQNVSRDDLMQRVTAASAGNFLYLVWLLPAIAAGTQRFDRLEALPQGLDGIYREFLRTRCTADTNAWRSRYRPLLGVLAVAKAPLTREQVRQLSGLSKQEVIDALDDLRQFLDPQGAEQDRYQLYHQSVIDLLSDEARAAEFYIDPQPVHWRIAEHYMDTVGARTGDWSRCDPYGLDHIVEHVVQANLSEDLLTRELDRIFTPSFREAREEVAGWQSPYLDDVQRIADKVPQRAAGICLEIILDSAKSLPNSYVSQTALRLLVALHPQTGFIGDARSSPGQTVNKVVEILGQQPRPPDALAQLSAMLDRVRNPRLKGVVALALGETGDREATPALLQLLKTGEYQERWAAANALIVLNDRSVVPELIEWYAQARKNGSDRERILYVLGWMHAQEARGLQRDGLGSTRSKNVGRAVDLMWQLGPVAGDADWLLGRLRHIVSSDARRPEALGPWKDEWLQKRLVTALYRLDVAEAVRDLLALSAHIAQRGLPKDEVKRGKLIQSIADALHRLGYRV
jgi:hypothetical protein